MPRFRVRTTGDGWESLRRDAEALAAIVRGEEVDLNQLGKLLSAVVGGSFAVFTEAGLASVRLEAAVKALEPKTPRSELERFARGSASDG
jgi:hypothetical protein